MVMVWWWCGGAVGRLVGHAVRGLFLGVHGEAATGRPAARAAARAVRVAIPGEPSSTESDLTHSDGRSVARGCRQGGGLCEPGNGRCTRGAAATFTGQSWHGDGLGYRILVTAAGVNKWRAGEPSCAFRTISAG